MPFPRRLLIEGEELVLDLRPHWISLVAPGLVATAGLVAAWWLSSLIDSDLDWLLWVVYLVLLLVYPVPRLVWWLTSNFAVTSDRVIHREGFIAKRSMEIPLEAINDVRFEQGIVDRMIGAGTLVIQSASEQGRQVFDNIRDPESVQKTLYHEGEKNKHRMFRGTADPAAPTPSPPPPPAAPSVTGELERLAELRAKGVLTEDEFQAQKARILGQG
jgi:membrane protein YdbS with pleckstrin-like domain